MSATFPPVLELVPQRPPMLLLDEVVAWDGATLRCAATVGADWLLLVDDSLPASALLEVMAQTVAALHGLQGRERGEPVRVGLLLGCRALALHVPRLPVGERVLASARQSFGMDAVTEFHCTVERAPRAGEASGPCLAEGTLHVVRSDLEAQPA